MRGSGKRCLDPPTEMKMGVTGFPLEKGIMGLKSVHIAKWAPVR
jgi:hypothetical protein